MFQIHSIIVRLKNYENINHLERFAVRFHPSVILIEGKKSDLFVEAEKLDLKIISSFYQITLVLVYVRILAILALFSTKKTSVSFDTFQVSFLFKNCFNHQHRLARFGQNYSHLDLHGGFPSIITLPDLVDKTSENDRQRHYQILFCLQIHLNKA